MYGNLCKVLSHAGKACCGLIADISELRFLGNFTDVYTEYGVVTELSEVGLTSMQDVGISLMKSESKIVADSKIAAKITSKNIKNEIVFQAEKHKNWKPKEVDTRCLLEKNLELVKKKDH